MTADLESQVQVQALHNDHRRLRRYRRGSLRDDYRTPGSALCRVLPGTEWLGGSQGRAGNIFDRLCQRTVLTVLKLFAVYHFVRLLYPILSSGCMLRGPYDRAAESLPASLASVIAADILYSNKATLLELLETYRSSRKCCLGWRFSLLISTTSACAFVYFVKAMRFCPKGFKHCTISHYLSLSLLTSILGLLHCVAGLFIFYNLCQAIREKLERLASNLRTSRAALTREGLSRLQKRWEHYAFLMEDLWITFRVFLWAWACSVTDCLLVVVNLAPSWAANVGSRLFVEHLAALVVQLGLTVVVVVYAVLVMRAMTMPRASLQDLSILKSSVHVTLHIDIQKFLYRLDRCLGTYLFQAVSVLYNLLLGVGLLVLSLAVRVAG